jgi:hypothetical protein
MGRVSTVLMDGVAASSLVEYAIMFHVQGGCDTPHTDSSLGCREDCREERNGDSSGTYCCCEAGCRMRATQHDSISAWFTETVGRKATAAL